MSSTTDTAHGPGHGPGHALAQQLTAICLAAPVIPVVTLHDPALAVPLARALSAGGLKAIEITLRTAAAWDAVEALLADPGDTHVGVGTVLAPEDLGRAAQLKVAFAVSPGATPGLLEAARRTGVAWLPGAATPSEMMALAAAGFTVQKLFPAQAVGGVSLLRAVAAPLPQLRFCPTGGITPNSAPEYLALRNVLCVGGTWITPDDALAARDWGRIQALARAAAALMPG